MKKSFRAQILFKLKKKNEINKKPLQKTDLFKIQEKRVNELN